MSGQTRDIARRAVAKLPETIASHLSISGLPPAKAGGPFPSQQEIIVSAKIIRFPHAAPAAGGEPPTTPPTIDDVTRMSVIELAAVGFRFRSATAESVVLEHDLYGELRLANGLGKA